MVADKKTGKKSSGKAAGSKSSATENQAKLKAKRQAASVLLFAGAILVLCIVLIPGERVWGAMQGFFRGSLGICSVLVPIVMGYLAVIISLESYTGSISGKLWQSGLLLLALCSMLYVFWYNVDRDYFESIGMCFESGLKFKGGGALGVMLGYPIEYFLTDMGAKIIFVLAAAAFVMLISGTTIITLLKGASTPVIKARESIETVIVDAAGRADKRADKSGEKRREKKKADYDIDIGGGYSGIDPDPGLEAEPENPRMSEPFANPADRANPADIPESNNPYDVPLGDMNAFPDIIEAADAAAEEHERKKNEKARKKSETIYESDTAYKRPPLSLLEDSVKTDVYAGENEQQAVSELLVKTLQEFNISVHLVGVSRGPTVTRYEFEPAPGIKISRITGLVDDLALRLASTGVRIEAPIPNKAAIGIEVPNKIGNTVRLKDILSADEFQKASGRLTVALGKDIAGNSIVTDLATMPHLLIAGTTGSGKSVCTNAMIQSVIFKASPKEVRMILIDPKQVEFNVYNGIPHLLVPVVNDPRKAAGALGWAVTEMLQRYNTFAEHNVRDIKSYNELAKKTPELDELPLILIMIDELSDLMMAAANEVEDAIIRLAQMARAAGMHLVIATQRPSVDVITGLIKANIPSRLALTVASAVDSRTILDGSGAERLLGKGDMLFMPLGIAKPIRVQGCFVSNREVEGVVSFLKDHESQDYDDQVIKEIERQAAAAESSAPQDTGDGYEDEHLPAAVECVIEAGQASTSMLQRKLRLGYARAARLVDTMEQKGIVGPSEGSKPRQVLMTRQQWLEINMHDSPFGKPMAASELPDEPQDISSRADDSPPF